MGADRQAGQAAGPQKELGPYAEAFMLIEKLLTANFSGLLFVETSSTPWQIWSSVDELSNCVSQSLGVSSRYDQSSVYNQMCAVTYICDDAGNSTCHRFSNGVREPFISG